jgi:hypothetical protein
MPPLRKYPQGIQAYNAGIDNADDHADDRVRSTRKIRAC